MSVNSSVPSDDLWNIEKALWPVISQERKQLCGNINASTVSLARQEVDPMLRSRLDLQESLPVLSVPISTDLGNSFKATKLDADSITQKNQEISDDQLKEITWLRREIMR
jgi:hypothetical protein